MSDVASTLEQNENGDNFKALVDIGESSIASVGHPESNQDRSYSNGLNTALVADGMGGYTGGEAAAKACLEAANISLNALTPNNKPSEIEQAFRTFFSEAASNVNSIVGKANAVAALASWSISPEGKRSVVVGWVGDARVYGFDRFGRLVKLTHDESFLRNSLLSEGETPEALRQIETIEHFLDHAQTEDDIKRYPKEQRALLEMANNTKHIASNSIRDDKPNIVTYDAENLALAGVFVTSDGIHDNLTDPEIQRIVTVSIEKGLNWSEIASKLAQEASQRSTQGLYRSKPDDCTVVGMTIPQTI
jgi:serine/threonine protein phosphatase PrpC